MATNFPTSLDNFTNPGPTDRQNIAVAARTHSGMHADTFDAIEALQAKVGIDGSAVATSHAYKLAQLAGVQALGITALRALSLFSPTLMSVETDHFRGTGTGTAATTIAALPWTSMNSGAGASLGHFDIDNEVANRPGVVYLNCGTTTTGRQGIYLGVLDITLGGGEVIHEWWIKTPDTLSDGTNAYTLRIGGGDDIVGGDHVDGVYFEYDHAASANWLMVTASSSSRTKTATGTVVAVSTWYKLRSVVNAAGTSVEFFINDVSVGTLVTNIPTGVTRNFGPSAKIVKSAGALAREFYIDWWGIAQTYAVAA